MSLINCEDDALLRVRADVAALAETLYTMNGKELADGMKFDPRLDDTATRCWNAAVIAYYNAASSRCELVVEAVDKLFIPVQVIESAPAA